MSDFVKVKKLTSATGGTVNFPNGVNIAGSDSGITGVKHTVSGTEPSTPANGDTWYDTTNEIYYVRMDNAWKNWLGSSSSSGGAGGNIDDGSTTIADYSYDDVSFDTGTVNVDYMFFKPDGTKLFVKQKQGSDHAILELHLSTAWDLSTASDSNSSFTGYGGQVSNGGIGLWFSTDGTSMYHGDLSTDSIYQYTLSTAWDVSTASYANKSLSIASQSSLFNGLIFNDDGTVLYAKADGTDNKLYKYNLSTAWDISTASYAGSSSDFDYGADVTTTSAVGMTFSPDGTSYFQGNYIPNTERGTYYQWDLTTAYDLSTASLTSNTLDFSSVDNNPRDLKFSSDGSKLYIGGSETDSIYQLSVGSSNWSVDLSNVSYDNKSFSVATIGSQTTSSWEVDFSANGTKMYVTDTNQDSIYQFSLSTAWDITTASYDNVSYSAGSQGNVRGSAFSADGTKLFIVENTGTHEVHQYSLSTAWDLSTASYDNVKLAPSDDVSSIGTYFYSVAFSPDGTKMFAAGSGQTGTSLILSYSLSTGYDLSTASYDNVSFDHSSQTPDLKRIVFNSDGTQFFQASGAQQKIYQYSMTTAYDLSTASYDNKTFSTASQETGVNNSVKFSTGGTKMYILGFGTDTVYQYSTESSGGSGVAWAGSRGMGVGGSDGSLLNTLQYFDLSTTGNATDFGDLTQAINKCTASSSGSRGVRIAGQITASPYYTDTIDYWTFATTGNATDFGDATGDHARRHATVGNGTRAISSGGVVYVNIIEYITIATTGNAQDFGDLITGLLDHFSTNDDTRGIFAGGNNQLDQTRKEMMDYITMATTGNSTDFGDLNTPTVSAGVGIVSDNTTGLFMGGGNTYSNQILKVTIATTGNSSDFGDLTASKAYLGQASYPTNARGVAMSGYLNPGSVRYNVIEYVTISTPGNAQDFGDLLSSSERVAGTSGNAS